jgi:hypothetical protein
MIDSPDCINQRPSTINLKNFAKEARIKLLDQVGRKQEFVLTHDKAELRGKF